MKKFILLSVLLCGGANAATMCVPDLSACDSCGAVSNNLHTFYVNCCGVDVMGLGIQNFNTTACGTSLNDPLFTVRTTGYCVCIMTWPIMATFAHVVPKGNESCGYICANNFNPYYAFNEDEQWQDYCNGFWGW